LYILALATQVFLGADAFSLSGNVTRIGIDDFDNDLHYGFLEITNADGESYRVVVDGDTEHLMTADTVQLQLEPWIQGQTESMAVPDTNQSWWKGSEVAVDSGKREATSASSRDGDRNILMIQVCLRDTCASYTDHDKLRKTMLEVDELTREGSYSRTSFPAALVSIFTSVVDHDIKSYTTCDSRRAIDAAMAVLVEQRKKDPSLPDPSKYRHIAYFIPREIPGCNWGGYAYVGGKVSCNRYADVRVITHELGHNIGMWHAASDWNDDGKQDSEYGDPTSVMGASVTAVNGLQRKKMGWMADHHKAELDACSDSEVILRDLELLNNSSAAPSGSKLLASIPRGTSVGGGTYYVSYRANQRRRLQNKVSVHYDKFRNTQIAVLLDTTSICKGSSCQSSSKWVGQGRTGSFDLSVESMDQVSATVRVKGCCGGPGCTTTTTTTTTGVPGTYYMMQKGSCCCPAQDRISTKDDCRSAHDALGLTRRTEWAGGTSAIPGGCSTRQGRSHDLHWNTVEPGRARSDLTPICRAASTTTGTTTPAAIPCSPLEASSYELVREVDIPDPKDDWDSDADVPYVVKKTIPSRISRVAYCLQLGDQWVWTSFDYTDASKVGIPTDFVLDRGVSNLNVHSNVAAVPSQTRTNGKLEFWDHCYGFSNGKYDDDDDMQASRPNCYGSMQVHSSGETIWSFNGWSNSNSCDVQIGHAANERGHTDGTFNNNCQHYGNGRGKLRAYVQVAPPSTTVTSTLTTTPTKSTTSTTSFAASSARTTTTTTAATTTMSSTTTSTAPPSSTTPAPTSTTAPMTTTTSTGSAIQSGDVIFLKTRSGNGNHIDAQGQTVQARWQSQGSWQAIRIEKQAGGAIASGDVVFLKTHRGVHIDVQGTEVHSNWNDHGTWQKLVIEKKSGGGDILPDDVVCLKAHTGKYLDVEDQVVQARWHDCGPWQQMMIQKEIEGAIFSGSSIHLVSKHTHNLMDVQADKVQCRWGERGLWQTLTIENYGGRVVYSGDAVFLKAHTGKMLDVQGSDVQARWTDYGNWQKMIIEKEGNGAIMPGDVIFLRAHTGNQIDVSGTSVQARWSEKGLWQSLVVEQATSRRLNVLDESASVAAEAILII